MHELTNTVRCSEGGGLGRRDSRPVDEQATAGESRASGGRGEEGWEARAGDDEGMIARWPAAGRAHGVGGRERGR